MRNAQRWEITGQTQHELTWAHFLSSTKIHGETWNWRQFFRNQISEFGVYCLSQVCPHVTLLVVWKCWQHYKLNNAISFPFFEQVGSGVCQNNRKIHFLLDLFSCLGGNLSKRGVAYRTISFHYPMSLNSKNVQKMTVEWFVTSACASLKRFLWISAIFYFLL